MIILIWIILSFVVGSMGSSRKIGFGGAFIAALLLSPIIGFFIVLASTSNTNLEMLDEIKKSNQAKDETPLASSMADELAKLKVLLTDGTITEAEHEAAKKKLLS
jgi:hypothetical protein